MCIQAYTLQAQLVHNCKWLDSCISFAAGSTLAGTPPRRMTSCDLSFLHMRSAAHSCASTSFSLTSNALPRSAANACSRQSQPLWRPRAVMSTLSCSMPAQTTCPTCSPTAVCWPKSLKARRLHSQPPNLLPRAARPPWQHVLPFHVG